jgi:phage replication-related protein YjqB (UPF0714/DUF867 family)
MRGSIFRPAICFCLDDDTCDSRAVSIGHDEFFAEQIARDFQNIGAGIEFARKLHWIIRRLRGLHRNTFNNRGKKA